MSDPGYIKDITKLLFESEPGLLSCEPTAVARAAASCAAVMGMVLASVLEKKGEATYRECLKGMLLKADAEARAVVAEARRQADAREVNNIN